GLFTLRPHDTPWYGARLEGAEAAIEALERAQRVAHTSLPRLIEDVARAAHQTGVTEATTVQEWLDQLAMLDGVRGALDVFLPQIFERSASDMVVATASRAWRKEQGHTMPGRTRRRLRRQAKDMLRPGRPVGDLHAELLRVQEQREIWRRHCSAGGWPRLPEGLSQLQREARAVSADLRALQGVIGAAAGNSDLFTMPLAELAEFMTKLSEDTEALRLMPQRSALDSQLTALGLGEFTADLARRRVATELAASEFDLAWWSSLLKEVLHTDQVLARYDGPALERLIARFRELDTAQTGTLTAPARRAAARHVSAVIDSHREEAEQLRQELQRPGDIRQSVARHPHIVGRLRPVWVVPPVLVPQLLPPGDRIDLLILDGAHHVPVAHIVGALARATQVVVLGDTRRGGEGALGALADLLPTITLATDRLPREESVAAFLTTQGYDDVITPLAVPPGDPGVRLELVDGSGMAAPGANAVESVTAEVERIVDLVIDHALSHPEQSLAVVALNARHADRLREAIIAEVANSAAVAEFFDAAAPEPFVVTDPSGATGLRRDAIILGVGFAKTPHGRVLHNFGAISGPQGRACLIDALEAVREKLTVVSSIGPGEIDPTRSRHDGPRLLGELIDFAARQGETPPAVEASPGPLFLDLAERLWLLGLTVVPHYGMPGGRRVPLALGHPDLPGELLLAVVTDDDRYVAEASLRRRERHWRQRLEGAGWHVHTVFSTALFLDPQREADNILNVVLDILAARQRGPHEARHA
ncbi:MAG TPA: DNA helicase, partial [Actinomycetaceae bacterium]|nr:DNA helicase [Actinomycetaceae bacterium]